MKFDVKTFTMLPSTQDYMKELAGEEPPENLAEGLVIQCIQQAKGRGRHGKTWDSPMGNLYMSVLLRPECEANIAGQISFIAANALSGAIDEFMDESHVKTLKWPNDVLIDSKKCAGILLESDLDSSGNVKWLALGIGVNIMCAPEGAIGVNDVIRQGLQAPIHPFRDRVLEHFGKRYGLWKTQGFEPVREEWMEHAHGLGQILKVNLVGKTFGGTFFGIDEMGALDIETADGMEKVYSGEIVMT